MGTHNLWCKTHQVGGKKVIVVEGVLAYFP